MKTAKELSLFCADLSSDQPSPGGGTASAAAGAMAASLLVMVCGVTLKSKKHESDWKELLSLKMQLEKDRAELIQLAEEDAEAYDMVVDASRKRKLEDSTATAREFEAALRNAAEVPMKTAVACLRVVETSARVAEIGKKGASSDVGVATHLAEAGFKGAALNVRINLEGMTDVRDVESLTKRVDLMQAKLGEAVVAAIAALDSQP